ncbi:MAG: FecR family protein [Bacteroidota bacterium]
MSKEKESMDKERLLHKYMDGTASQKEIELLELDPVYAAYIKIASTSAEMETPPFNAERNLEKIADKLHEAPKVRRLNPVRMVFRVAAAAAILIVGFWFIRNSETTITTQIAQKKEIQLPDTSEVFLNAGSEISYNENKWDQNRSLTLEGEAYFKVSKGKTFSVETSQGTVQVLGTQFNVFSRDSLFNIQCFEGLVSVTYNNTTVKVPAGNLVRIANEKRIEKSKIVTSSPNWIANESTFENVSLSLVLNELQRQYPIKINTQNIVNKKFTGSFTHKDLNVALRSICDPLQVAFTIEGEEVTLYAKTNN